MSPLSTCLRLLVSLLVASSQARCFLRTYDLDDDLLEPDPVYPVKERIGFVSSFEKPGLVELYELIYEPSGVYFYTADPGERQAVLGSPGWENFFENMWVFNAAGPDRVELHRFFYAATGVNVWSTDTAEVDRLKGTSGWTYLGVACYLPTQGSDLYRHSSPDLST